MNKQNGIVLCTLYRPRGIVTRKTRNLVISLFFLSVCVCVCVCVCVNWECWQYKFECG